jgi:hypothetical protein
VYTKLKIINTVFYFQSDRNKLISKLFLGLILSRIAGAASIFDA